MTSTVRYAVIVAGGVGKRMGSGVPKQFIEIAGKPILMRTIECFYAFDDSINIIVVLPKNHIPVWDHLIKEHGFSISHTIVPGGDTRFLSVKNGLNVVDNESFVAIHDGVRPLVSLEVIERCFEMAEKHGNAVPVVGSIDSVRLKNPRGSSVIDRKSVMMVQTPQVFSSRLIKAAYKQEYKPDFTDDATVLENLGHEIKLVEGNKENIKITTPEDLLIANALLNKSQSADL